tara:strand:+ start:7219 stop:8040 length:822 start_codon:yes stop_codon:yes gene_type:complete
MSEPDKELEQHSEEYAVSVIVPCHNHEDMLGNAIDSIFIQQYRPIQIVVVNDGSSDNPELPILERAKLISKEVLGDPAEGLHKSVFLNEENGIKINLIDVKKAGGPSRARNIGMHSVFNETDLFMMLDADDLYLEEKICKSVEKYSEDPNSIGIVYTDAIIKNINTGTEVHEFRQPYDRSSLELECIISNTPLVSKVAIYESGGYDEEMRTCEDWDLWLRITENFVAVHIPEALHVYHVTGKNSSDTVPKEVWQENWSKIYSRLMQRRNVTSN